MAQYRVRPGMEHGAMKQHKAGDVVEMSPAEAAAFADKLELVEQPTTERTETTEEKRKGSKEAGKKAAEGDAK